MDCGSNHVNSLSLELPLEMLTRWEKAFGVAVWRSEESLLERNNKVITLVPNPVQLKQDVPGTFKSVTSIAPYPEP
jgi:hypothetical protein